MQPYFLPYLGYFDLIDKSDLFIAFDTAQYMRQGWVNRNKIETGYIRVPVKKHQNRVAIKDVEISDCDWRTDLFNKLKVYRKSPVYDKIINFLERCLEPEFETIGELNIHVLKEVCELLGITTPIVAYSKMSLNLGTVKSPDEWALRISEALGATTYLNLPGGKEFFDKSKWKDIELRFLDTKPGLSIIHDLMENRSELCEYFS